MLVDHRGLSTRERKRRGPVRARPVVGDLDVHRIGKTPDLDVHPSTGQAAHKGPKIRAWARKNKVELCFTPTYASWANPIEAHFGPLRQFTIANSCHPNHTVQTRMLQAYLRWRNANARYPDVLAAQRRERAGVHSEKGIRRGGPWRPRHDPTR